MGEADVWLASIEFAKAVATLQHEAIWRRFGSCVTLCFCVSTTWIAMFTTHTVALPGAESAVFVRFCGTSSPHWRSRRPRCLITRGAKLAGLMPARRPCPTQRQLLWSNTLHQHQCSSTRHPHLSTLTSWNLLCQSSRSRRFLRCRSSRNRRGSASPICSRHPNFRELGNHSRSPCDLCGDCGHGRGGVTSPCRTCSSDS